MINMKDMKKMNTKQETGKMSTNYPLFNPYSTLTCPRNAHRSVFYIVAVAAMLLLGGWNTQAWGNTLNVSGTGFKDKVSSNVATLGGNHVSFKFSGSTVEYSSTFKNVYLGSIDNNSSSSYTISWTKNSDCTLNITKIQVKGSASANGTMQLSGGSESSKGQSFDVSTTSISGTSATLTCRGKAGKVMGFGVPSLFYITDIIITYTITPNQPTVNETTATINVSLSNDNPTKLDMTTLIGVSDVTDFMPVSFGNSSFTQTGGIGSAAGAFDGKYFYATQAGVYTYTNPYIAAKTNCHEKSTSTTGTITITVNRLNQTLTVKNGSINVSIDKTHPTDSLDLSTCINSHVGNGAITYTLVSGPISSTGEVAANNCKIDGKNFSAWVGGTYTLRATAATTAQYNSTYKDFTVTVNRLTQTISWSTDESVFVEEDVITATSIGDVTLEKSGTGAEYVTIDGNTATVGEVETNSSVTLTATAAQTDVYAQATGSKTITLTSLQKQHITFEQNLTKLKTTDGTKKVELVATSDSGRDSYITFAVDANAAGVSVTHEGDKWYLNYTEAAVKGIAVTASLAGVEGVSVAASDVSQMVKVTDPTAKCDINEGLATASGLANTTKTYDLTIPKQVVLKVRSSKSKIYTNTYEVKFYDKNNKEISTGSTQSWTGRTWDQTIDTRTFSNLNKDIVKMVFKSNASNGFDITEASYTRWSYANPSVNLLDFEALALSTVADQTFTLSYANYQVELSIEGSSNFVLKSADAFGDCETYGTETIKVGYNVPAEATEETAFLYVRDNTGTQLAKITLHATVQGGLTQNITSHNIGTAYKTTDLVNLTATTDRGLTNFSYSATPAGVANFDGAQMTFSKFGTIAITVTEAGNGAYAEASATVKNVVVSKVSPAIATIPTSGTKIQYLQTLNNSTIANNGKATVTLRGVENTEVAGTWAWSNPTQVIKDNEGTHNYEVTFTPTDGGMYATNTCMVPVTILLAPQVIEIKDGSVKVAVDGLDAGAADSKLDLNSLIESQTQDVVNSVKRDGVVTYTVISDNKGNATIDANNIFSATKIGEYTIRATKAETEYYNAVTADFKVTVEKRANTLSIAAATYEKYVDAQINAIRSKQNSDATVQTSSSDATIAYYDVENNKILIPNSEAKSFDKTEVTIKIWQDETARFEASGEKTITLTVKKYDNAILVKGVANYVNTITTDTYDNEFVFTANNTDYANFPIIVSQTAGEDIATYFDTEENPKVVYSNSKLGIATWSVNQAENYKYKAAANTFTVKVENAAMGQCFMYENTTEYTVTTHIVSMQGEETEGWQIPDAQNAQYLYYDARKDLGAFEYFFIQYSKNGTDWTDLDNPDLNELATYKTYGPIDVSDIDFTYLRAVAKTGATLSKYIKNIRLTRKPNLSAEGISITKTADNQALYFGNVGAGKVNVNWSVVDGGDIRIVSDNEKFTIPEDLIDNTNCNSGTTDITILYHPTSTNEESATITIYNTNQRVEVTVTGKAEKAPQTIVWYINGEAVDTRSNPKPAVHTTDVITARTSRNHEVTFTSVSNAELMKITDNGTLIPLQEGEVTVYAHGAVDAEDAATYAEVNDQLTFVVTEAAIQTIVWNQTFLGLNQDNEDIPLTAYAKWTDEQGEEQHREVTYSVADESVAQVIDGKLDILAPGTTIITATAPGGEEDGITFLEATASKKIVVRDPNADCDLLIYAQTEERTADCGYNLTHLMNRSIIFDLEEYGEPRTCNFDYAGATRRDLVGVYYFYAGKVKVEQYLSTTRQWVEVETSLPAYKKGSKDGEKGAYVNSGDIVLDPHATKIQVSVYDAVGYFYVNNMQITLARYLETDQETMELGEHSVGDVFMNEVPLEISYSNVAGPITITSSKPDLFYVAEENRMLDVECGAVGMKLVNVFYHPIVESESDEAVLTISDGKMTKEVTLHASTVDLRYIFNSENTTWEQNNNWIGKDAPTTGDYIVEIQTDVVLTSNVSVYSLTIDEGATLTIADGGVLTVGDGNTMQKGVYGNLHVAKNGQLKLGAGTVIINDFILDAALSDNQHNGISGQVLNSQNLVVDGEAYFDLTLDQSGACSPGWYDFAVPFPVSTTSGVSRWENGVLNNNLKIETNYAIMNHSETVRSTGNYPWKKYHGIMQPNESYTITIDNVYPVYRFRKVAGAAINTNKVISVQATAGAAETDRGWNGLGNGSLAISDLAESSDFKVQLYDHTDNAYSTHRAGDVRFAVGAAFFVQASSNGTVTLQESANSNKALRAQSREPRIVEEFKVSFAATNGSQAADNLYISASEDALSEYEIGHDLVKLGTMKEAKIGQLWCTAYNMQLCDAELPLNDNQADFPISMYAPVAGTYTLSIGEAPQDATVYLTQDGANIWNLSFSDYEMDLSKGTTTGYGLRIIAEEKVATGVENMKSEDTMAQKLLINGVLYIQRDGALYDATGKRVQ